MRRVSIANLEVGTALGKTIYNERGDALLKKGTVLSSRYITLLLEKGVRYVYVQDQDTADVEMEDIVSEHVRANATKTIFRFLDVVERAAKRSSFDVTKEAPMRGQLAQKVGDFRKATLDTGVHETLHKVIEDIIDEVLDAPIMTGLSAIKTHDNYTFCHSVDVSIAAIMIGKKLFLDRPELRTLALGCLLHDAGKIFIDPAILNKPGPLTPAEFDQVKKHPTLGYHMLKSLQPEEILANQVAYQHHERQDGRGYPQGLRSTNRIARDGPSERRMTLIAEIAAVADVYDALTADRPYRRGMSPEQIVDVVKSMAGPALNREIVGHFLAVLPVYPVGIEVMVKSGRYRGSRGIVVRVNQRTIDRPIVRILWDSDGKRISGTEIDLSKETEVDIAAVLE